jgi:hypothetical protein
MAGAAGMKANPFFLGDLFRKHPLLGAIDHLWKALKAIGRAVR